MEAYTQFFTLLYSSQIVRIALVAIVFVAIFYFYKKRGGSAGGMHNTKVLNMYSVDLTNQAKKNALDPVIGRDEEIHRVTQVLSRRTKNNVILIGQPGVGKTAVVEGLANRIAAKEVPDILLNKRVLLLQVSELLAGTKYRGEFEQRIKELVQEIRNSQRTIILFIDEIHAVTQTKGTEGAVNLSDILKPALARGDLQLIGATTKKEYEQYIQPDESWERRFQVVTVDEPTISESIKILQGIKKKYEDYHKVKISDEAISTAVRLSQEYIKGRRLPDKAIDVMDEAAAMVKVEQSSDHGQAAGILHGAAKKVSENSKTQFPAVDVQNVKEVVAEWVNMNIKDIH
jgi:ATP-dependent Clp protease ATP-binding subunit ClpC